MSNWFCLAGGWIRCGQPGRIDEHEWRPDAVTTNSNPVLPKGKIRRSKENLPQNRQIVFGLCTAKWVLSSTSGFEFIIYDNDFSSYANYKMIIVWCFIPFLSQDNGLVEIEFLHVFTMSFLFHHVIWVMVQAFRKYNLKYVLWIFKNDDGAKTHKKVYIKIDIASVFFYIS